MIDYKFFIVFRPLFLEKKLYSVQDRPGSNLGEFERNEIERIIITQIDLSGFYLLENV